MCSIYIRVPNSPLLLLGSLHIVTSVLLSTASTRGISRSRLLMQKKMRKPRIEIRVLCVLQKVHSEVYFVFFYVH
jgi:predicted O-linked N-acetylglucosamine transferase (SPINDLY family)